MDMRGLVGVNPDCSCSQPMKWTCERAIVVIERQRQIPIGQANRRDFAVRVRNRRLQGRTPENALQMTAQQSPGDILKHFWNILRHFVQIFFDNALHNVEETRFFSLETLAEKYCQTDKGLGYHLLRVYRKNHSNFGTVAISLNIKQSANCSI